MTTTDLGTLGGSYSFSYGVNATGQVVGVSSTTGDAESHAFSWTQTEGMVDLGTLGGAYSEANGVNGNGQVVGRSNIAGDATRHAFFWTRVDGMVDLGTLGGSFSEAYAVNASGQVVGISSTAGDAAIRAFSWTQADGMVDLGTLGGNSSVMSCCLGHNVSDGGQVVGQSHTSGNTAQHAFLWTQADGMVDLGTLPGGNFSIAYAVNASGQVVGQSWPPEYEAFSWTQADGFVDLGKGSANAVNASGQVVGGRRFAAGDHAFSWTQAGGIVDLGTLGGTYSQAVALSTSGQAVGVSYIAGDAAQHGFSWTQAGRIVDLGTLGGGSSYAQAVNDNGQVVGWASTAGDQETHATLWEIGSMDSTPPTIVCGSADGVWHASDVAIDCTADDSESGLADLADQSFALATSVPANTETANASTSTRQICDNAGNCATAGPIAGNMVDKKAPQITLTSPPAGIVYIYRQSIPASFSCADAGSGTSAPGFCTGTPLDGANVDTRTPGARTFVVSSKDVVGNAASSVSHAYSVRFAFGGFYAPLKNQPTYINVVQSGRGVPVPFSLRDYFGTSIYGTFGLAIFTGTGPSSTQIACPNATKNAVNQSTTLSGLRYISTSGQYEYDWPTPASWKGTCRALTFKFKDGTSHVVNFLFK